MRIRNFNKKKKTFIKSITLNNISLRDIYAIIKINFFNRYFIYQNINNYI